MNLKKFEEKFCKECKLAYTEKCLTPEECNSGFLDFAKSFDKIMKRNEKI